MSARRGTPETFFGGGGLDPAALAGQRLPELRNLFRKAFGEATRSNNAAWLRSKLTKPRAASGGTLSAVAVVAKPARKRVYKRRGDYYESESGGGSARQSGDEEADVLFTVFDDGAAAETFEPTALERTLGMEHYRFHRGMVDVLRQGRISHSQLFYMDEAKLCRPPGAYGLPNLVMYGTIEASGWVDVKFYDRYWNPEDVLSYFDYGDDFRGDYFGRAIPRGSILLLDRLGQHGRANAPDLTHWDPSLKRAALAAGVGLGLLPGPGGGRCFSPIEPAFIYLKKLIQEEHPVGPEQTRKAASAAVQKMNQQPQLFRDFYDDCVCGTQAVRE